MGWHNNGRAKHGGMGWRNVYCSRSMEEWGGAIMDSRSMEEWGGVMYAAREAWRNGVAQ